MLIVERVARAIALEHGADPDALGPAGTHAINEPGGVGMILSDHRGPLWKMWEDDAVAAIAAVREADAADLKTLVDGITSGASNDEIVAASRKGEA